MIIEHTNFDRRFREFLRGKTVGVVGGCQFSVDYEPLKLCDVVVTFGHHIYDRLERSDINYYHGTNDRNEMLRDRKALNSARYLRFVVVCCSPPFPRVFDDFEYWAKANSIDVGGYLCGEYPETNPIAPELELFNTLSKKLRTRPLTGFCAIEHLLSMPIERLFVTGMSFYRGSIGHGGKYPEMVGPHHIPRHVRYLQRLVEEDARVVVAPRLRDMMNVVNLQHPQKKENENYDALKATIIGALKDAKSKA